MASVPSAGCLLARNQYYRSKCSGVGSCPGYPHPPPGPRGLPEIVDKCWWIKSFFHSEPSPPTTVGRKTLSAS
ncbi:PDPFL protein, partial [Brachypteracias leptosomus]|nr:PDPFL protein [Brachypteracias leptosomus]